MSQYRKKPVTIEATQWFKNGDHPDDYPPNRVWTDGNGCALNAAQLSDLVEGSVVRRFRQPDVPGAQACRHCGKTMHAHGWISTLEGGHIVCPGDWIITGVEGERYPCKPSVFAQTYESALEPGRIV